MEVTIDCAVTTSQELHQRLKEGLDLPYFYGMNWSALWDCLTGMVEGPIHLTLQNFSVYAEANPEEARTLLNLLADVQRTDFTYSVE